MSSGALYAPELARGEDGQAALTFTTRARVDSSAAIAGGRVFVGSNDGRVYGLDLASGKKVWEYEAASPVTSSPAIAKGKVVVATADGQVICFG
jgi:eukaryotic-like serine/threonine-protein kinase